MKIYRNFILFIWFALLAVSEAFGSNSSRGRYFEVDVATATHRNSPLFLSRPTAFSPDLLLANMPTERTRLKILAINELFDKEQVRTQKLPSTGTFFWRLKNIPSDEQFAIKLPELGVYRLYFNGQLSSERGRLNPQSSRRNPLERGSVIVPLPQKSKVEVALQVDTSAFGWFMPLGKITVAPLSKTLQDQRNDDLILAWIIGCIFIISVYQMVIYLLNRRDASYLVLATYCALMGIRLALGSDTAFIARLYPDLNWEWSWKIGFLAYYISIPLFILFLYREFEGTIRKNHLVTIALISFAYSQLTLFTNNSVYGQFNWTYHLTFLYAVGVCLLSLYRAVRDQHHGSRVMLFGFFGVVACACYEILAIQGFVPKQSLLLFGILFFIFIEAIILAMKFSRSFATLSHTEHELSKVVYPHMINRIVSGAQLESTMPQGFEHAVIISFDIVASTRIQHPNFPIALEKLMAELQHLLNEHYDEDKFIANGYRLKEMGDGLLVSIGFPFHHPGNKNLAQHAIEVGERMAEIFKNVMDAAQMTNQNCYCGIGIVEGMVEGFFPLSGTKQYDLRGRAVNLATRYEAMRKVVYYEQGIQGSVIFIQDTVYQQISKAAKKLYHLWDCRVEGHRIRDDITADRAWYRFVPGSIGPVQTKSDQSSLPSTA